MTEETTPSVELVTEPVKPAKKQYQLIAQQQQKQQQQQHQQQQQKQQQKQKQPSSANAYFVRAPPVQAPIVVGQGINRVQLRTLLYTKQDTVYYLSTYITLFIFWFLTWLFILLALRDQPTETALNGQFWSMVALAIVAGVMVGITFCLNEVEHSGPITLIVFIIYAASFTFVMMWLTWEFTTWLIFYIFTILVALNFTLLLAILITSYLPDIKDMTATVLGLLAIGYVLIVLVVVATATSTSLLHCFISAIANLAVAAYFVFDASNIAQKRYRMLLARDTTDMTSEEMSLDDVADGFVGAYRLYLNLVAGGFYIYDMVQLQNEKKKLLRQKEAEEQRKKRKQEDKEEEERETTDEEKALVPL